MQKFSYTALNSSNKRVQGNIVAMSTNHAKSMIYAMRYKPLKVTRVSATTHEDDLDEIRPVLGNYIYWDADNTLQFNLSNKGPNNKAIIRFTTQFATLLKAGVPLTEALNILAEQQENKQFQMEIKKIRRMIEKGSALSAAMSAINERFDTLYLAVVRSGESTGQLDTSLDYITSYLERNQRLKDQLKSALTYPTLVGIVAAGIVWGMLTFVVPSLAKNFPEGKELPALTKVVMAASDFCGELWLETLLGVILSIIAFHFWKKTAGGKVVYDRLIIKLPGIGNVVHKICVSRFCNVMSSMLSSGVPLIDVIETSIECSDNAYMASHFKAMKKKVEGGDKLSKALRETNMMPGLALSMMSIGEQSGKLDSMLSKVSEYFDEEVQHAADRILSLIEPFLIVVVGGFVAVMLVAIYLPMFDMANNF